MPLSKDGKICSFKGKKIRLYPVSALAEALGKALDSPRTTQTIRKWETNGIIPPATFRVNGKRMYTKEQIDTICRVAKECNIRQGCATSMAEFTLRVEVELKEVQRKLLGK